MGKSARRRNTAGIAAKRYRNASLRYSSINGWSNCMASSAWSSCTIKVRAFRLLATGPGYMEPNAPPRIRKAMPYASINDAMTEASDSDFGQ